MSLFVSNTRESEGRLKSQARKRSLRDLSKLLRKDYLETELGNLNIEELLLAQPSEEDQAAKRIKNDVKDVTRICERILLSTC